MGSLLDFWRGLLRLCRPLTPAPALPPPPVIITPERLKAFAPGCNAVAIAPMLQAAADEFEINTPRRIACWLGELHHESQGFTRLTENLNYSALRLTVVWPKRFPTTEDAEPYARNPEKLANKVYGLRFGNTEPGDGWRYRGRGFTGLTFKDNYRSIGPMIGEDLVTNPDRAADPRVAARIAGAYWVSKGLNALADKRDVAAITKAIQGGSLGLSERLALVEKAEGIFT